MDRLREQLSALDRAYSTGHHGRWSASRRAGLVDDCVRELFEGLGTPRGVALCAIGGYGRGELAPRSDVDLLLLHRERDPAELRGLAERILYPLWDSGLTLGHAVRSPEECVAGTGDRLEIATSLLDLRFVAGDEGIASETRASVRAAVAADLSGFAEKLAADRIRRGERYGSVSHLLEPSLKEGMGGLRDAHVLHWLAVVATGPGDVASLVTARVLRRSEAGAIGEAEEYLMRARSAVHLVTGRSANRLRREEQPEVAEALGFVDEPGLRAEDALMRALFEHARKLEHATGAALRRVASRGEGAAGESVELPESPEDVLEVFAVAAEDRAEPALAVLDAVEELDLPREIRWTPAVLDAFLRLLRSGDGAAGALEALDRIGFLERFLPAWSAVRCRPQRDPFHRFPVDVHLLETLRGASRLLANPPEDDPVAAEAVRTIADAGPLLVAALLHDIGKTGGGGHVAIGAGIASDTVARMGLQRAAADMVLFLVENHLLLSDTATRRDLQDAELVGELAARTATPERLAALYLLTAADAEATGPHAWTPWRRTLIRELVAKVQRGLERGVDPREEERAAAWELELRDALDPSEELDRFLEGMPRSYRLAVPVELAATHASLVAPEVGTHEVRTSVVPGSREGTWSLTVVAADRPGLLSWIAGALSLAGLSILSAQVFTTNDDVAVDVFEVVGAFDPDVGENRWRRFRSTLRKVLEGRLSLDHGVSELRSNYPAPSVEIPLGVTVDNDASDFYTVIEVGAPDRIGLLYEMTRTLAELDVDVHLAKVATYGARVIDAFYVRDVLGRKIEDPARSQEIERRLLQRLSV
ncbi:MAG: [protein-PII] uridylyltransferase [Actinomycetota bacterium]|nr:[protein-PII] uridylyltransferase [Actinomycetota bacterium]